MKFVAIIAFTAIAVTAYGAFAESVYDGGGTATGTNRNEITMPGEGHKLIKSNSNYLSFDMNDPSHPFSKMQDECFGSFEIRAPNAAGSGNCVFRDAAGNISANRFDVTGMTAQGALTGT